MNICGHCGGADRHLADCKVDGVAYTRAGLDAGRSVSSPDLQHAAPHPDIPRSPLLLLTGLAIMFAGLFAMALIWP